MKWRKGYGINLKKIVTDALASLPDMFDFEAAEANCSALKPPGKNIRPPRTENRAKKRSTPLP
jgi:hypothetical protein